MCHVVMCLMWLRVLYGYVFYEAMCLIWLLLSVSGLACDYRTGLSGVILAIGKGGGGICQYAFAYWQVDVLIYIK